MVPLNGTATPFLSLFAVACTFSGRVMLVPRRPICCVGRGVSSWNYQLLLLKGLIHVEWESDLLCAVCHLKTGYVTVALSGNLVGFQGKVGMIPSPSPTCPWPGQHERAYAVRTVVYYKHTGGVDAVEFLVLLAVVDLHVSRSAG